ncbi:MAG: hypothetical protein U0Q11_17570 [Vicinamibacterales bacterium]
MTLHDLIQPSFSFLVGLVVPMSISTRIRKGHSRADLTRHALWRGLLLVLLGIVLRQLHHRRVDVTFEDTLTQIGLGYPVLFGLAWLRRRTLTIGLGALLAGTWLLYVAYPLPGPGFDYAAVGVTPAFLASHPLTGLAAHFQMNSNIGWAADRVWLNLFPQSQPFVFNEGGYVTISSVPNIATMVLGLLACPVLTDPRPDAHRFVRLAVYGLACMALGLVLSISGLCPIVKRLWTPSFVLFSGGLCLLTLTACALLAATISGRWTFALRVVQTNSLLAYLMAELLSDPIESRLASVMRLLSASPTSSPYLPFVAGLGTMLLEWILLYELFRRRRFLRL